MLPRPSQVLISKVSVGAYRDKGKLGMLGMARGRGVRIASRRVRDEMQ